jgi:two-component system, OmpR family, phosphate regulon sensor histidine kinase PhoR
MHQQTLASLRHSLIQALRSCATESDIVQVLYTKLNPIFAYEVVNISVLEREGWYHAINVDLGVLQDVRRRPLSESITAEWYKQGKTVVAYPAGRAHAANRGPGAGRTPRTVVWLPIEHRDQIIGSVLYQTYRRRSVPPEEVSFLEEVHRSLGVLVANAYLNETTRNQAVRLTALNAIARALSSTLDERGVVAALHHTITQWVRVDVTELVAPEEGPERMVRLLRYGSGQDVVSTRVPWRSPLVADARPVMEHGSSYMQSDAGPEDPYPSTIWVPIKEGDQVRGALSIQATARDAYEDSTLTFLEQVADEVALAVRNAWSYAAIEAQRRRLEVVNSVGRRLASSLDKWSIMRTLREELARHLDFDGFILATIRKTDEGPIAEGYQFASGVEQPVYAVPLAVAGPSREAYETGRPVLVRRSPWARSVETHRPTAESSLVVGEGAAFFVAPGGRAGRVATRSFVWVPVIHGEETSALLSLQSYEPDAFTEWHVSLLQDVAAHVSLALANADHFAAAQQERRRLEALHMIELGVAGSADERQIAEAVFSVASDYLEANNMVLAYTDPQGRVAGFLSEHGRPVRPLEPLLPVEKTNYFKRLVEQGRTINERVPEDIRRPESSWIGEDRRIPTEVLWVPITQGDRVVGALSAQRFEDKQFGEADIQLLESASPVVGIALRTVRLHRANELALAQSVRIQEVAALAGHDLASVVSSVADQARTMLDASGVACWAFDTEGRQSAHSVAGDPVAAKILSWTGRTPDRGWDEAPASVLSGTNKGLAWRLIPLWYADRLVGCVGWMLGGAPDEELSPAALDFARHAAIAIENARLVAETRGRIHTLEAVAAFTELDPTQPSSTRAEMARLIERALSGSDGALWLLDATTLVRQPGDGQHPRRIDIGDPAWLQRALRQLGFARRLKHLLRSVSGGAGEVNATPLLVDGVLAGMLTANASGASLTETRRLMSVLAGQAAVVLGRLRLVDALDRERRMMNAILRHSPVGVILEDAQGRIVYANPEVESIYRVPAADMAGRRSEEILAEAGAVVSEREPEVEGDTVELQMKDPDRIVQVRRVPIPGLEDEPAGVLTLHEDVTQQRQVLEAKDLMLRAIGHEVRSPAAAMKTTLAGIMQWEELIGPQERQALLQEAYEMSDRLLSLVEGQLIIAKLETRRFEPNPAAVPLRKALEQVMGVLRHRYGDERASVVEVKLREGLPMAYCEPTHLDQVLTNLIGNALEYTRAPIHVTARARDGWLEVTVADEGPGLPPDRLETLFEKTGPAGQNRSRGGLGLGLYLCRLVVERSFGGRIWLEATGRGGTTFKFTVPAAEVPVRQAHAVATAGS